jgi:hypothetical protein
MKNNAFDDFKYARDEVSASSAGGAPFLISYGCTFVLTGILSYFLAREISALIVIFQGAVALPAAFWLERSMRESWMSADNPLRNLSTQLAISQALAIPFLIVVYNINPGQIPVVMAGLGGVHFLPYGWLHRTRIYVALAAIISIGSFTLVLGLQTKAYEIILIFVGLCYWIAAPLVYRHAKQMKSMAKS